MLEFISQNLATIIGAAIVLGIFALIIARQIINHKKNKGGCGCGCEGCASASICHPSQGSKGR